jgi:hypothetical protein
VIHEGSIIDVIFVTVTLRHSTKKDDESLEINEEPENLLKRTEEREINGETKDQKCVLP